MTKEEHEAACKTCQEAADRLNKPYGYFFTLNGNLYCDVVNNNNETIFSKIFHPQSKNN